MYMPAQHSTPSHVCCCNSTTDKTAKKYPAATAAKSNRSEPGLVAKAPLSPRASPPVRPYAVVRKYFSCPAQTHNQSTHMHDMSPFVSACCA